MVIIDAHQDLAYNMLTFGRDYTRPAQETRRLEAGGTTPLYNDDSMLGWLDYRRGRVGLVFATLFAAPIRRRGGAWDTQCYADTAEARRVYSGQLDAYQRLVERAPDKFRLVLTAAELTAVLAAWEEAPDLAEPPADQEPEAEKGVPTMLGGPETPGGPAVGLVISMEGAEAVGEPSELEEWWGRGVRLVGPAWSGTRFCGGTGEPGPLTSEGFALLEVMADLGFGLDLSHMDEKAAFQALDSYPGTIIASHSNALALLKGSSSNRHLSDRLIEGILERDGMIGVVPFNMFLKHGWRRGDRRDEVSIEHIVGQIDYICQMAGDALHAGIGSDFDGGFGLQSIPPGMDSVADLQKLGPLLAKRGYTQADIAAILGGNWAARLQRILA